MEKIDVIIPVYKPGRELFTLVDRLMKQTLPVNKIYLVNTEREEFAKLISTEAFLTKYPGRVEVKHIAQSEFDHGRVRHDAVMASDAEIVCLMTMDAIPADRYLLERLTAPLKVDKVAASYARQLPKKHCNEPERYTRKFNYPAESMIKGEENLPVLGIKTFFCSNVCAAYRKDIYVKLGGFPTRAIFNEDMIYAYGLIKAGYRICYAADARVYHSHNYTGKQQFQRNFDLGVSQAENPDVFQKIPSEKEGGKLVISTVKYMLKEKKFFWIPRFLYQCACKYAGYLMGKNYRYLPRKVIMACTMSPYYWK